jgi:hypothetical protein
LGHHGNACSFEAILKKYELLGDPALVLLGKIVNGADTDNSLWINLKARDCRRLPRASVIWVIKTIMRLTRRNGSFMTHFMLIVSK